MNSFINKFKKWFKNSSFGVILTSVALILVISVGLIINNDETLEVANSINNFEELSNSENNESSHITSPSVVEKETIQQPFLVDATISCYFFDSSDSIETKSQALIKYENKFVPSMGVSYTYNNKTFDVVCSFEGTVVEKINDPLFGLTIVVENKEGLKAHYSGLSEVSVYVSQSLCQGQKIGKSGESIINASFGNHLYFALEDDKGFINPLKAYDKTIEEVKR